MKLTINEIVTTFKISHSSAFLWFTYHEDVKTLLKYAYFVKVCEIDNKKLLWLKEQFSPKLEVKEGEDREKAIYLHEQRIYILNEKREELKKNIKPFILKKMPTTEEYLDRAIEVFLLNLSDKQMIGYYNLFFS